MALVFPIFFIMGLGTSRRRAWAASRGAGSRGPDLDSGGRLGDGRHHHPARAEHGALHVLSADAGTSSLLHRRDAARRRLLDLGRRGDDCQLPLVAARAPRVPVPLSMHGMLATVIIWYLANVGPRDRGRRHADSLVARHGRQDRSLLARIYFWWFGHPFVYFLLLPAYVLCTTCSASQAGGSSAIRSRAWHSSCSSSFHSVGFHHQFTDPGISAGWKLAHTVTTYAVVYPSFVTAFTVIASLEVAGRMKGARGLFNWIGRLPWADPFFSSVALSMIAFVFGGFGGVINAAYAMNAMVHNTAWIQGHFHVTLGTTVALSFMGATYWLLPRLTDVPALSVARANSAISWFGGMVFFSTSYHISRAARYASLRLWRH